MITQRQPWHAHYDPDVRTTLGEYPQRTLLDYLRDAVREGPGKPAIIFKRRTITFAELDRLSDAFASGLAAIGVKPGDRVALVLPNTPQFVVAELGTWKAGAVVVPLNPVYTASELQRPLANCGAEVAIVLTPFLASVRACRPHTRIRRIVATNVKEFLRPLDKVLFTLFRERSGGHRATLVEGELWFGDLLRQHAGQKAPAVTVGAADNAVLLMSGGTTGTPKETLAPHRSYIISGLQLREWTKSVCHDWTDTIMVPLPLFHVYANVGVQGLAFVGHNALALVPNPREIDDVLDTIEQVRPTFFAAVPTLLIAILNHPRVKAGKVGFQSIKVSFSGAAALMADTKKRFEELTGGRIIEGYSLTEAMMACLVNPMRGANKSGSVGLPLPDVEAAIVDPVQGETRLPAGDVGEIVIRGPQLMTSYWNDPAETAIVLRDHGDGGPWLHTGDLGYVDTDGFMFILDRKKDLIKTSGYQVWPREVEEALASHPAVAEVGVAGVSDPLKGQVVRAWVVLRAGMTASEQELRDHCRTVLAPYKVPARIEFRSELPKTMVGKVLRRKLMAEAQASIGTPSA